MTLTKDITLEINGVEFITEVKYYFNTADGDCDIEALWLFTEKSTVNIYSLIPQLRSVILTKLDIDHD